MISAIPMAGPRVVGQEAYDEARRLHKLTAGGTIGPRVHGPIKGKDELVLPPIPTTVAQDTPLADVPVVVGLAMIRQAPNERLAVMQASEEGRNGGARKTLLDAIAQRMKA